MKHVLAAVAFAATTVAHAAFIDGNLLHQRASNEGTDYAYAIGYVIGVVDTADGEEFCIPQNANAGQLMDIVRAFLRQYPEVRHYNAASLVAVALKRKYPCAKNGKST